MLVWVAATAINFGVLMLQPEVGLVVIEIGV
jgi:hypothetical protein